MYAALTAVAVLERALREVPAEGAHHNLRQRIGENSVHLFPCSLNEIVGLHDVLRTFPLMAVRPVERARKLLFVAPTGRTQRDNHSTPQFMGVTVCGVDYNGL